MERSYFVGVTERTASRREAWSSQAQEGHDKPTYHQDGQHDDANNVASSPRLSRRHLSQQKERLR